MSCLIGLRPARCIPPNPPFTLPIPSLLRHSIHSTAPLFASDHRRSRSGIVADMHKSQLQELCQRRQWPLPEYATSWEGPDHDSRFSSTVTVNGSSFHSLDLFRTSKEAQNKAALVALEQLSDAVPQSIPGDSPPPPTPVPALPIDLGEFFYSCILYFASGSAFWMGKLS